MAKYNFIIFSPYVGADVVEEIEIPDEELDGLNSEEKEKYLNDSVHDWMLHTVEYGWRKVEE